MMRPWSSSSNFTSVPGGHSAATWPGRCRTPSSPTTAYSEPLATLGADAAALHGDGAREGRRDLGLVGDHDDRGAEVVAEGVDQVQDVVAVVVAELAGGLVGEQQPRRRWPPSRRGRGAGAGRRTWSRRPGRPARSRPTRSSSSRSSMASRRSGVAEGEPGEGDVLPGGGIGQQVAGGALQHRARPARADAGEVALTHPGDLLVAEEDPAGAGASGCRRAASSSVDLPEPTGAEERDALPGPRWSGRPRAARPRRARRTSCRGGRLPRSERRVRRPGSSSTVGHARTAPNPLSGLKPGAHQRLPTLT